MQLRQIVDPEPEDVPLGQFAQLDESVVPVAVKYLPAVQGLQLAVPDTLWKVPAPQLLQVLELEAPVDAEYFPAEHFKHLVEPLASP